MTSLFRFIYFCYAVVNIALIAGIVNAAMYFDKWPLLWFLIIVLLNHPGDLEYRERGKQEDDD